MTITEPKLTREDVQRIIDEARAAGERIDLAGRDLSGLDLSRLDLRGAYLRYADLRGAYLRYADLRGAYLRYAELRGADLRYAYLRGAYLRGAYLRDADLRDADLRGADCVLAVQGLPSGDAVLTPTPDGWALRVGCWGNGTTAYGPSELRTLAMSDIEEDWPDARGPEIADRRPSLLLLADLCDDHIRRHAGVIAELAEKWPSDATDNDRD